MNNRTLLVVFLVLLTIYGLTRLFRDKRDSNFRTELIQVDTAAVTTIVIDPKGAEPEFNLKREENGWIASNGQLSLRATGASVNTLLGAVHLIKTKNIVAKDPGKWGDYEVTDSASTRIRLFRGETLVEDFIVGRFNFNPQTRSGISYVRLTGENEVYAVDGFLTITFGQGFDAYRNRQLLAMQPDMEVTNLQYQTPDSLLTLALNNGEWWLGNSRALDSTSVDSYLNGLRNLTGDQFADDFDEMRIPALPARSLTLTGKNIDTPLMITSYYDSTRAERSFVLRSSQDPDTFFASDSTGLYNRIFQELDDLVQE